MPQTHARQKLPKQLAVISADNCTGCEACREVCPVDCILLVEVDHGVKGSECWCEIDLERCIGCRLCVALPTGKGDPHTLEICPWDAIEMVPTEQVAGAVGQMGGPPEYVAANRPRLVGTAQRLAEQKAAAG